MERPHLNFSSNYFLDGKRMTRAAELREKISEFEEYVNLRKKYVSWIDNIKGPVFVPIDVTYRCNLRCPYCYVDAPHRTKPAELSKSEVFEILENLRELDVLGTCLCGGEPTLRTDLPEIIEYAKECRMIVNMVTNGVLMRESLASRLAEAGINTVQVSLDGSRAEIMDTLRGRGTYEKAVNAIKILRDFDIPVIVSFCSTKLNISDFPNVVELCSKIDVWSVRSMFFVPESEKMLQLVPNEEQYQWLINWIFSNQGKLPVYVEFGDPTEHIVLGPYIGHLSFSLSAEGWILPSPYLNLAYGSIKENLADLWLELREIWVRNPVFRAISENLNSELDFMRLSKLFLTRSGNENVVDVRRLNEGELETLAEKIREVLQCDGEN